MRIMCPRLVSLRRWTSNWVNAEGTVPFRAHRQLERVSLAIWGGGACVFSHCGILISTLLETRATLGLYCPYRIAQDIANLETSGSAIPTMRRRDLHWTENLYRGGLIAFLGIENIPLILHLFFQGSTCKQLNQWYWQCFPATKKRSEPEPSKRDFFQDIAKVIGIGTNATGLNGTLANITGVPSAASIKPAPVSVAAPKETTARNYGMLFADRLRHDSIANILRSMRWDRMERTYKVP